MWVDKLWVVKILLILVVVVQVDFRRSQMTAAESLEKEFREQVC